MHVVFSESNAFSREKSIEEDDYGGLEESMNELMQKDKTRENDKLQPQQKEEKNLMEGSQTHSGNTLNLPTDFSHVNHKVQILGDPLQGVKTKASLKNIYNDKTFLSQIEPKGFNKVEKDELWIFVM